MIINNKLGIELGEKNEFKVENLTNFDKILNKKVIR